MSQLDPGRKLLEPTGDEDIFSCAATCWAPRVHAPNDQKYGATVDVEFLLYNSPIKLNI